MIKINENVYLIKPGEIVYENDIARYASSSVVLIKEDFIIIIDTGLREDWREIRKGLGKVNVEPDEVEILINTHLHGDHIGCNDKFVKAVKYAHPEELSSFGYNEFKSVPDKISDRTSILKTPGHVHGHVSVVFDNDIIIAGDAIPTREHYEKRKIPAIHTDEETARNSLNKICEIARVIIPGHDHPIKTRN